MLFQLRLMGVDLLPPGGHNGNSGFDQWEKGAARACLSPFTGVAGSSVRGRGEFRSGLESKEQVKALMARRDKMVAHFEKLVSQKGESEVIY